MKIKIVSICPSHLNLNGDQANLMVALKRLEWRGYEGELVSVEKGRSLPEDPDFIFLGHGSLAAWRDVDDYLTQNLIWLRRSISNGSAFMAVASGHEWSIRNGIFPGSLNTRPRVSKFEIHELDGQEILGYLNSATSAPIIQKSGLLLGTQLHGPIFAKNPELVDAYMSELLQSRGFAVADAAASLTGGSEISRNNNADLVAGIVKQVWDLERRLASE